MLWVSPLPPVRSGVSDYSAELLPYLARAVRLRVATPPGWRDGEWAPPAEAALVAGDRPAREDDIVVVHLGNNPHHIWTLRHLEGPGRIVVVLHDLVLHHLLVESTLATGDFAAYERLLVAAHGHQGEALAAARRWGFTGPRDPFLFPARRPFLERAAMAVTHSRWGAERVARERPDLPVETVPMGVADPGPVDRAAVRRELGVGERELVLMHLGFLTPAKGLHVVLAAVAAATRRGVAVRLVLVGEGGAGGGPLREAAAALGIEDRLTGTGWVDVEAMRRLPAAADLGVVIRSPSAGETSAAALRFLACGTPVAVTGLHQLLEIPPAAAPRLTPGCEAADLLRLLLQLAARRPRAGVRRAEARRAYDAGHRLERAAAAWEAVLRRLGADRAG